MTNEIVLSNSSNMIAPAGTVQDFLNMYQIKKQIIEGILREGVDYGAVPGTDKPTLKKAGAEKMNNFYALFPSYVDVETVEDWNGDSHSGEPFFYYRQKCELYKVIDGQRVLIASADGSCNSWEKKYRYRESQRTCPNCGKETIIKGKQEYGGGWICYTKKGGCGSKYADGDKVITGQNAGVIPNPDVADLVNTILKMAQKRALVAATLLATNTSDYFTQDMEDFVTGEIINPVSVSVKHQPVENINQETGEINPAIEMIEVMGSWAVQYAAEKWNCKPSEAAPRLVQMKLGKTIAKTDFIEIVDNPQ